MPEMNGAAADLLAPEDQERIVDTEEPLHAPRGNVRRSIPSTTERVVRTANQDVVVTKATWARTENLTRLRMAPEPKRLQTSGERVELLQQWEGVVEEVEGEEFFARLSDRTNPAREQEVATFECAEVSTDDLPLLVPGAVFYWSISYRVARHGQKTRTSSIKFRRLPAWSANDIRRLKESTLFDDVFTNNAAE